MQDIFIMEATKYNVFPLDNSVVTRLNAPRPHLGPERTLYTYKGTISQVPHGAAPHVLNRSYTITAEVLIPSSGAEGILATQGGRFGGYGFYLLKSKPVFVWNLLDFERIRWEGNTTIAPGKHTVEFEFTYQGPGLGKGGEGVLRVDGKEVSRKSMTRTIPFILQWDEAFNVGVDTGTPVDDKDYKIPFAFTGKIDKLTINLAPQQLNAEEKRQYDWRNRRNNAASE